MSKSIQQLRERRNASALELRKLMDATKDIKWGNLHQTQYDQLDMEADKEFNQLANHNPKKPKKDGDELSPSTLNQ